MANTAQSRKRARQNDARRAHTQARRSRVRTFLKKVLAAIQTGDKSAAQEAYRTAVSELDKAAGKGLYHKNKAARHKSRLAAKIKAMA